jgi:hypothetical protein
VWTIQNNGIHVRDLVGDTAVKAPSSVVSGNYDYVPPPGKQHLTISSTTGGTTTPATGVWEYDQGSTAQVTATPDKGYTFKQWILDNNPVTPVQPTIIVVMDADHALVAVFESVPPTPPTLNLLSLALLAGLVLIAPKR